MIFTRLASPTRCRVFLRKCAGNLRTLVACQLEFSLLMISDAFYLNLWWLARYKIVTWDTRTGVSHTRLVFMVPRTSVTVCKSVLTYSLLHVAARTRLLLICVSRGSRICRRTKSVISLPFDVNYYRGRINANERREPGKKC